ncbi:metallophosphoesterase [Streptomyces reniochalinae]|uniref:Metallophosphoesterase n=1 Tax=Streptomyces reniochalinae TaxID=2250578 RepID=A0A367EQ21_9ACTN|nr:metallophosphoesterase [Streptomyces reniochalinae]RCG19300.1 metallophosphoesterase [Streptomyces reniochalinae]
MAAVLVLVGLVVLGALVGAHLYLWRRFVRDVTSPGGWWRRTGTVLAVLLPLTTIGALVSGQAGAPFLLEQILAWPGYLWLACLLYLMLALLAAEVVRWVLRRTAWGRARAAASRTDGPVPAPAPEPAPSESAPAGSDPATGGAGSAGSLTVPLSAPVPTRRVFLARTLALTAGAAGLGTTAAGAYGVLNGPTLKHLTVPLAKLGERASGFRIAVVSDIHLGPILGRAHTQRIVDTINRTQPDLVTIVGDLVDGTVADLGPAAEPLRALRSRHGSYFVTGNHEYFGDAHAWVDHLRELNVHPLENARRELPGFDLAGVNDIQGEAQGEGPDYDKALGDRDTSRAVVLMAHQPVMVHQAADHHVDLQLSGHTHGGQLWPGPYLAALANPTVAGLDRYGDTQLYVTRGAGAWGPPVRVGAESDVTVVTLAAKG